MSSNDVSENQPLIGEHIGRSRSILRRADTGNAFNPRPEMYRNFGRTMSSVRFRTSCDALTTLSGDGLAPDDPSGMFIRENTRGTVLSRATGRMSIMDPELECDDESVHSETTRKNVFNGNIMKIILILITIGIYTFGPILISYAQWIPGVQFDYKNKQTGEDFYNFGTTHEGTKVYESMKNDASSLEFISVNEFEKAQGDGEEKKSVCKLRMDQLYEAARTSDYTRTWEGRIELPPAGSKFSFYVVGRGNYNVEIKMTNKDGVILTEGVENNQKVSSMRNENGLTASTPVIVEASGEIFYTIVTTFAKTQALFSNDDCLSLKWYNGAPPANVEEQIKTGRTLKFWKHGDSSEIEIINNILASDKSYLETEGQLPKGEVYNPLVIVFLYQCVSLVLALMLSVYVAFKHNQEDKFVYLKMCFNYKNILMFLPCSVGWVFGDLAEMLAASGLDPAVYNVLTQLRLVLTAVVAMLLLKKKQSTIQWIILTALTCTVITFQISDKSGGGADFDIFPYLMVVLKVSISVLCGVYAEKVFKGVCVPFPVQVANILMVSVPFAGIALYPMGLTTAVTKASLDIFKYGWFGGPDFGFDWRTWVVLFFYVGRQWLTNLCIKRFSAVVKNICNAVAPLCTYILQISAFPLVQYKVFDLSKIFIIFVVVCEVTNYSLARTYYKDGQGPNTIAQEQESEIHRSVSQAKNNSVEDVTRSPSHISEEDASQNV